MKRYVLRRLIMAVATLLVVLLILFVLLQLMPGSPFNDEKLTDAQRALLYQKYGLDKPILTQFFKYVANMCRGDFGLSYNISKNTPITALLKTTLPTSLALGAEAVVLGALLGLGLGLLAGLKHNTGWDTVTTVVSVLGVSVPSYVFALGLLYCFAYKLPWFKTLYDTAIPFKSSVLPAIAMGMFTLASIARFTRSELLEVLDSDYILLAESKGITGGPLIWRHVLRNTLIPVVTVLAPLIVGLMTGSMVVERIFSIPGIGNLLYKAITSNDYNVVIVLSFIYSAMYIAIMLLVDILYGVIDPRIRVSKEGGHD